MITQADIQECRAEKAVFVSLRHDHLRSKDGADARASRESRFNPRPAPLSWLAIVGASSRQFNNSIRSGNWSTARRADSRRIGGSDINGLDSAPPAPLMAA